jgi:hypothetical protein
MSSSGLRRSSGGLRGKTEPLLDGSGSIIRT